MKRFLSMFVYLCFLNEDNHQSLPSFLEGVGGGVTLSMRGRGRAEASAILTPKIRRMQWLYVVQISGWRTNY